MEQHAIAVIGTINRDIITSPSGERSESLGGILYNVLALAELGTGLFSIFPVSYIGSDVKEKLSDLLKVQTGISLSGITETNGKTNTNYLWYVNANERKETAIFHMPAISLNMVTPFLDCSLLLFNFISGYDVTLDTLMAVRRETRALIFLDVHSMVLKREENTERLFIPVDNWQTWTRQVDIMQMNSKELLYFTGNADGAGGNDPAAVVAGMRTLLEVGTRLVLVTAGSRGVYLGSPSGIQFFRQKYSAPVRDTTGCGDIFTSAFITKFLATRDPSISCDFANTLAGLAVSEAGIKKCLTLRHASLRFD